jgi:hypothetical protein
MTLCITTFDIECLYNECRWAACHIFTVKMIVILLNVITLIVIMLSVVAPTQRPSSNGNVETDKYPSGHL